MEYIQEEADLTNQSEDEHKINCPTQALISSGLCIPSFEAIYLAK
jgi:hypothetical protein